MKKILSFISLCLFALLFLSNATASANNNELRMDIPSSFSSEPMYVGETSTLWYSLYKGDEDITFSKQYDKTKVISSDTSIIEIKDTFDMIAKKSGTVKIIIKNGTAKQSFKITVLEYGVSHNYKSLMLGINDYLTLRGKFLTESNVKVTSSNNKIATVKSDNYGGYNVIPKKLGKVTITVSTGKSYRKNSIFSCSVT